MKEDTKFAAWRALALGQIVQIRAGAVGAWAGSIVRVVARFDFENRGIDRYCVEACPQFCEKAPWHGYDQAMQYDGSRIDVCRWELTNAKPATVSTVRKFDRLWTDKEREHDRKTMPHLVDLHRRIRNNVVVDSGVVHG